MAIHRLFLGISLFALCAGALIPSNVSAATNRYKAAETAPGNPGTEPAAPLASGVGWDLSGFFPTFRGPEMKTFCDAIRKDGMFLVTDHPAEVWVRK